MVDFTEVLGKKATEVEKPKPRPVGTYLAVVQGLPKQRKVTPKDGGEDMPVIAFTLKLMSALPDVDSEKLQDHPDISTWGSMTHDMFLHTEGGVYAFRQFLTNTLGIEEGDKSLGEMVTEAPGKQLLVKVKHEPYINRQNEADISTRVESLAHV